MDIIKVFALGGLDEDGRDCYVIDINNDLFVIDCGVSLPDKTIPGIDFLLPNPSFLINNKDRIKAYIITHGHDESMAALQYFYEKAPAVIVCSESTRRTMIRLAKIRKTGSYFDFKIVDPSSDFEIAGRKFHTFQTCHNFANSFGVAIETDQGNIIYSGDYIIDYSVNQSGYLFNMKALSRICDNNPTLLLIAESKKASTPGYCSPHHLISPIVKKYFLEANKRIFITCFWQNLFRIREIFELAKEGKKKIYFYDEYTKKIITNFMEIDEGLLDKNDIISKEDLLRVRMQDIVVLMLGIDGELYDEMIALSLGRNEDKRIAINENDIFINAALARPSMETAQTHAIDAIYRTGCTVIALKNKQISSMHAHQDDLKALLSVTKPRYYFPIRGNFVNMMANAKLALSMDIGLNHNSVFVLDNGMTILLDGTRPKIIPNDPEKIAIDPAMVDGIGISSHSNADLINERRELGNDGVVVVASTVSLSKKQIVSGPDCQMRGFVYVKEAEPLLKSIVNIYVDEINTAFQSGKDNFELAKTNIELRVKRFIKRENGREPMILPIIVVSE